MITVERLSKEMNEVITDKFDTDDCRIVEGVVVIIENGVTTMIPLDKVWQVIVEPED